jgi:hypothetical protein
VIVTAWMTGTPSLLQKGLRWCLGSGRRSFSKDQPAVFVRCIAGWLRLVVRV